jgi:conjugative transfer signal peptidase TraF
MRRRALFLTGAGIGLALFGLVASPMDRLIWNRTGSAPQGLYWLSDEPFTHGRWVVVSARSAEAQWAEEQGFVGRDWPLLKQIAGVSGDEICRSGVEVSINERAVAQAREVDSRGRALPVWRGCKVLGPDEFFLLTPHPDSLDGRYFGAIERGDLTGVAIPLLISDE